jgi:hypothetical protein
LPFLVFACCASNCIAATECEKINIFRQIISSLFALGDDYEFLFLWHHVICISICMFFLEFLIIFDFMFAMRRIEIAAAERETERERERVCGDNFQGDEDLLLFSPVI